MAGTIAHQQRGEVKDQVKENLLATQLTAEYSGRVEGPVTKMHLYEMLPDPDVVVALAPEELAGAILQMLNFRLASNNAHHNRRFNVRGLVAELHPHNGKSTYPDGRVNQIGNAVAEAWYWLLNHGLLVPDPDQEIWCGVSRRGQKIVSDKAFADFRSSAKFPRELLHQAIANKVWIDFAKADYDTAVFKAFKEVEIAVRHGSGSPATLVGVKLMRAAFDKDHGLLADKNDTDAEREMLMHLFAGAIGSYKNPHSHRTVSITDPVEAIEIITLASHLYRITEARASAAGRPLP